MTSSARSILKVEYPNQHNCYTEIMPRDSFCLCWASLSTQLFLIILTKLSVVKMICHVFESEEVRTRFFTEILSILLSVNKYKVF